MTAHLAMHLASMAPFVGYGAVVAVDLMHLAYLNWKARRL